MPTAQVAVSHRLGDQMPQPPRNGLRAATGSCGTSRRACGAGTKTASRCASGQSCKSPCDTAFRDDLKIHSTSLLGTQSAVTPGNPSAVDVDMWSAIELCVRALPGQTFVHARAESVRMNRSTACIFRRSILDRAISISLHAPAAPQTSTTCSVRTDWVPGRGCRNAAASSWSSVIPLQRKARSCTEPWATFMRNERAVPAPLRLRA